MNSLPEELLEKKVLLRFGYGTTICVSMKAAITVVAALAEENVLLKDTNYKNGASIEYLKPWGTEQISISLISPMEFLKLTTNAEGN
jgi:hypothetical protein